MASLSSSASSSLGPVGFVGVGIMGEGMAMNLLKGGKTLILWNRSKAKCDPLTSAYPDTCVVVDTPQEVVAKCATTFCMLSTLEASQAVFPQVLEAVTPGKSIVDCATLTPEYMQEMEAKVMKDSFLGARWPLLLLLLLLLRPHSSHLFSLLFVLHLFK